jgi:ribulose-phosphate 3-epimerase
MFKILDSQLQSQIQFFSYRWRFLVVFIAIGVASLMLEIVIRRMVYTVGLPDLVGSVLGIVSGIFIAYWLNARFNFKVPPARRSKAFRVFTLISLLSLLCNYLLRFSFFDLRIDYERGRLLSSALLFSLAYMLHLRYSFQGFKEVGIAVYVNNAEDIRLIRQKVGEFPSFIHVDIVDESFNSDCSLPSTERMEVVRACWERKQIHAHVMSSAPRFWMKGVLAYCDVAIFHIEGVADLEDILEEARIAGKKVGIAIRMETPLDLLMPYLNSVDIVLLLAIANPGQSGQLFQMEVLERIAALDQLPERSHFEICVDGGVNDQNISLLKVEKVVSGSFVLNSHDSCRRIMRLQTSSNYEAI